MLMTSGMAVPFGLTAAVAPLKAPAVAVMRRQTFTAIKAVFMASRWWRRMEAVRASELGPDCLVATS